MTYKVQFSYDDCQPNDNGGLVCRGKPKKIFIYASNCSSTDDGMKCTVPTGVSEAPRIGSCNRFDPQTLVGKYIAEVIDSIEEGDYILHGYGTAEDTLKCEQWKCKPDPSKGEIRNVCTKNGSKKDLDKSLVLRKTILAANYNDNHLISNNLLHICLHLMGKANADSSKMWEDFRKNMNSASPKDVIPNGTGRDIKVSDDKITFTFSVVDDSYLNMFTNNAVSVEFTLRKKYMPNIGRDYSNPSDTAKQTRVGTRDVFGLIKDGKWRRIQCFFRKLRIYS